MKSIKQLAQALVTAATLLLAQPIHAETFYFHNDHLGTPQALTDDSGAVVWQGNYNPFGEVNETTDTVEQNIRFPGQYFEEETGLHYNYFRDYDPSTGRYIESDPVGLQGGINTFGYVSGNPVQNLDIYGLTGFFGGEAGGGRYGVGASGGLTAVTCRDGEGCNSKERTYFYAKLCFGLSTPGPIASASGGAVQNFDCNDPSAYTGYFFETTVSAGPVGYGVDIGLEDDGGFIPIPNGNPSEINEAGYVGGIPGASAMLCYYYYLGEK